jgi:hypothetical protein
VAVRSDEHKDTLGVMLLCLLARLDGAKPHPQRPGAMVTGWLSSQQVADRSKYRHIPWRAHGATPGLDCPMAPTHMRCLACKIEDAARTLQCARGGSTHPRFTVEGSAPSTSEVPRHITIYRRVRRETNYLLSGMAALSFRAGCNPGCWGTPEAAQTKPYCAQYGVPARICQRT